MQGIKVANKSDEKVVAKAKAEACKYLYDSLEDGEDGQRQATRIAKQANRVPQDVYQGNQMKDRNEVVLNEDNDITKRWRTHFGQPLNVESDRIERTAATIEEVERVFRKIKRAKQQFRMTSWWKHRRSEGKTGVYKLLEIFKTIMEREKMPDMERNSTLIPIGKNKGHIKYCDKYI